MNGLSQRRVGGVSARLTAPLVVLAAACAFSFAAIVEAAFADDYHVTCAGHGFINGSSNTDGSFFSRVEAGCGPNSRYCDIYVGGVFKGGLSVQSTSTCNAWSRNYGDYLECNSTAHTQMLPYFSDHTHKSSGYCG
ncbi:MAG: hypothetical protein ACR2NB_11745 [Solirubrobacteraceae bacterium]